MGLSWGFIDKIWGVLRKDVTNVLSQKLIEIIFEKFVTLQFYKNLDFFLIWNFLNKKVKKFNVTSSVT